MGRSKMRLVKKQGGPLEKLSESSESGSSGKYARRKRASREKALGSSA